MKIKQLLLVPAAMLIATSALAGDEATYSTEGYCLLKKEGVNSGYLEAYADKLGFTPNRKTCKSFNDYVKNVKPKEWDYQGGKPYPGSVIRLTKSQIAKIKAAKGQ